MSAAQISRPVGEYTPYINWKHVDGPLLICSDGTLHWLTWFERILLAFGSTDEYALDAKYVKHWKL